MSIQELQQEVQELSQKKIGYVKDKEAGVAKLRGDYRKKHRQVEIDATYKVKPIGEEQTKRQQQLVEETRREIARIEQETQQQITALRRSLQSRTAKAEAALRKSRDQINSEFNQKAHEVRNWMKTTQAEVYEERDLAIATMEQEYDERIEECDAQLEVLIEALKMEQEEEKQRKAEAKKASEERRKARQEKDKAKKRNKSRNEKRA